jgi:hypothetical protein
VASGVDARPPLVARVRFVAGEVGAGLPLVARVRSVACSVDAGPPPAVRVHSIAHEAEAGPPPAAEIRSVARKVDAAHHRGAAAALQGLAFAARVGLGVRVTAHSAGRVWGSAHEPPGEWIPAPGLDGSCGRYHPPTYDIPVLILWWIRLEVRLGAGSDHLSACGVARVATPYDIPVLILWWIRLEVRLGAESDHLSACGAARVATPYDILVLILPRSGWTRGLG